MMEQSNYRIDSLLNKPEFIKFLICPVCMDILSDPIIEIKNQHIFCKSCVQSDQCPICRESVEFHEAQLAKQLLSELPMRCIFDEEECSWKGIYKNLNSHLLQCPVILANDMIHLSEVLIQMKNLLEIEYSGHLFECHTELFENIIQQWDYLSNDLNEWDFWAGYLEYPCELCNLISEKYGDNLKQLDEQRITLMKKVNQ